MDDNTLLPKKLSNDIENVFEQFFYLSTEMACILDVNGQLKSINNAFLTYLSISEPDLFKQSFFSLIHKDDLIKIQREISTIYQGNRLLNFSSRLYKKRSEEWRVINWSVASPDGVLMYAIARDVTYDQMRITELERRANEMNHVSSLNDYLQSCCNENDVKDVVNAMLSQLFSQQKGALYLYDDSDGANIQAVTWGGYFHKGAILHDECWAIRRGKGHSSQGGDGALVCAHLKQETEFSFSYCLPILAQSQVFGLLSMTSMEVLNESYIEAICNQIGLAIARERLKKEVLHDPLTGLHNRRYMDEYLHVELIRSRRNKTELCVLMLDLDDFKAFNDSYGHSTADEYLKKLAVIIKKQVRASDAVCRFGGEEFVIVLPESNIDNAMLCAKKIQKAIKGIKIQLNGEVCNTMTLSIGIASSYKHGCDIASLLSYADKGMYVSKDLGKNKISVADVVEASLSPIKEQVAG